MFTVRSFLRKGSALAIMAVLALILTSCSSSSSSSAAANSKSNTSGKGPVIIGAVIDQTSYMKSFDDPALNAAEIWAKKINAAGGVDGRKIEFKVYNDQLKPALTRSDALKAVAAGAKILWVTCDVDLATPAVEVGLEHGLLTVSPCTSTNQMGPERFGSLGKLAFTFGNAPESDGAVLAQLLMQHGWKTATVVTDHSLSYFVSVCKYFTHDFTLMGGHVVSQLSFTAGDHTSGQVGTQAASLPSAATVLCTTTTPSLPTFVTAFRTAGNNKPIVGPWSIDGGFWEPKNPTISNNIWWSTFASVFGDDPNPQVRSLLAELQAKGEAPATGGFVTGPTALQGIVAAIKDTGGSLNGAKLAAAMQSFKNLPTLSGPVSFSAAFHSVVGRPYRIIEVTNGHPHFVELLSPGKYASER